ncbi:hypothetical protein ACW9PK_01775 [Kocuria sp. MNB10]
MIEPGGEDVDGPLRPVVGEQFRCAAERDSGHLLGPEPCIHEDVDLVPAQREDQIHR